MAAIDRMYLKTWDEYQELKRWIDSVGVVHDDFGNTFCLSNYLWPRTQKDFERLKKGDDLSIWSLPKYIDIWLIRNCPLEFIQENLREQYSGGWSKTALTGYNPDDQYQQILEHRSIYDTYKRNGLGKASRVSINYKYKARFRDSHMVWWIDILGVGWWYCRKYDCWMESSFDMYDRSGDGDLSSTCIRKGYLSKKKLMRLIQKWNLPEGTQIRFTGDYDRYIMQEFVVTVRKPKSRNYRKLSKKELEILVGLE